MDIDRLISKRMESHNRELEKIERRLSEYKGLMSEKEIKLEESYYRFVKRLKLIGLEVFNTRKTRSWNKIVFPDPVEDWDFGLDSWGLDTTRYVSPPSSLRLTAPQITDFPILCRNSNTLNIKEGRIVSYVWIGYQGNLGEFLFRNQNPVGTVALGDGYLVIVEFQYGEEPMSIIFKKIVNGSGITLKQYQITNEVPIGRWNHLRVSWWLDPNWNALVIRLEKYTSDWETIVADVVDVEPSFNDSSINRVGFDFRNAQTGVTCSCWLDDFEVWVAS